jgi:hypothetical protein
MYYQSSIIVGLYTYLQEYEDKNIETLFSNAIDLFNALGSWIYGNSSPKIIYPDLKIFVKKANDVSTQNFSHLLDYINWSGNQLYKILEHNQWIEEHYYESFTLRKSDEITTGLFFMWRIGMLIVKIEDITNENKKSLPLNMLNSFTDLFDAFGKWIYHQEEFSNIASNLQMFQKILELEHDPLFDEMIVEAKNMRKNIAKFLQKI